MGEVPVTPGPLDSEETGAAPSRVATLEAALAKSLRVINHLEGRLAAPATTTTPVAVVGIACRFPGGADDPDGFWRLLETGRDVSGPAPLDRWPATAGTRPRGYFLDQVPYGVDDRLFRISPEEIRSLDPQQRLLLELAWEAFEDAGIPQARFAGSRTGVFIGAEKSDFMRAGLYSGDATRITPYTATGVALSAAAGRLAYMFDLRGPCHALDAACASSLVAIDEACAALRRGACDLALAGAVSLMLAEEPFLALDRLGALSADGRCKAFSAAADGYARGEGGAVLVLKPLDAAMAAGDRIHGVILGSAVRHGGRSNGLTAPSLTAQEAVIRAALADAAVAPEAVDYIEAHGTGTPLGDPIEMAAIEAVFGAKREAPLQVGAVKTNVGHLETAAGLAGVIKVLLCLRHDSIAPQLHLGTPSPHIPWEALPVAVTTAAHPWPRRADRRRIAGISAFGFTGTVAHLVVAEPSVNPVPVAQAPGIAERPWHIVTASARSESALAANMAALAGVAPVVPLADLAFSANAGRTPFEHRAAAIVRNGAELQAAFAEGGTGSLHRGQAPTSAPRIAFAFTGQGSQYRAMGRGLYDTAPAFRAVIEQAAAALRGRIDLPLQALLFGPEAQPEPLDDTANAQPALVAFELALAALWQSWGITPALVLGHSVGEIAAAQLAGVLSLEDALRLAATRGRLVRDHAPAGGMAVVFAPWDRAEAVLRAAGIDTAEEVVAAAFNAPARLTIAGAPAAVARAGAALSAAGIKVRSLAVSHAFHAPLLRPVVAPFRAALGTVAMQPARVPVISGMTGSLAAPGELASTEYWCRHLLQPVRFAEAATALAAARIDCVIEIGPSAVLTGLARQGGADGPAWLPSLTGPGDEWPPLLDTLARLYLRGAPIDWAGFDAGRTRRRVGLPTYRFQRRHEAPARTGPDFRQVADSFDAITRFGRDRLGAAMARLGLFAVLEDAPTVEALGARLGVVPAYARLFTWIVEILAADGVLRLSGDRVLRGDAVPRPVEPVEGLLARHPDMTAMARLLTACLDAYPEVLRGLRNPIEILFPGGSMELVESVYQTGAVSEQFNRLMAREVAAAARPGARIIEIGTGTGGTTQAILPALVPLAATGLRYACTDISAAFARRLEARFGTTYPFTEFATLDIERDVAAQGFAPGGYDVVVAANVLHATRNMAGTLAQAARLLRPGGRLVLNEVTRAHECVGLTFGLTPGWWLYEDAALRLPNSPVLDLRGWHAALAQAGFATMEAHGLEGDDMDMPVQAVMVARRDEAAGAVAPAMGDDLVKLIGRITGIAIGPQDADTNLFELGLDSLLLMQVKQGIARDFGVEVEMGQFYAELATPARLAAFIGPAAGVAAPPVAAPAVAAPPVALPMPPPSPARPAAPQAADGLVRIVEQQLELMRRQLDLLGGTASVPAIATPVPVPVPPAPRLPAPPRTMPAARAPQADGGIGPRQHRFIADLVTRYTARTARSKAYAAAARPVLGDWIATIGFRPELKEMIYPIVSVGSRGSHIQDLDGNDYVDLAMGFGVGFFGHSPPFVMEAVRERLDRGFELATQSDLAADTARLVHELTGCERVVFSNTGTEAVMTAFRLARTVTGRRRVAHFKSAFHGFYDGVMAVGGREGAVPMVPGIVPSQVEDVLVLDYGTPESLRALEAVADTLAGVMVEPVQSRNPDLQPRDFLHELRRITERHGIALIFDELVNGFRIHPGGAQAHFGVRADIVTYGKMVGGGMPISIIAGNARFLDAIDGGDWKFGDESRPAATMTFFGGTFCRHPLSIAATHACLRFMRDQGPALQEGMNQRTADLAGRLNAVFRDGGAPFRVAWFSSQFQVRHALPAGETFQSLELSVFFFLMMEKGIYTWERRVCFLSIAHDDKDLDRVVDAARRSVAEMREGGFFADAPTGGGMGAAPSDPARLALTPGQRDLAFRAAQGSAASLGFAEPLVIDLAGPVDAAAMQVALDAVVARHDALRITQVSGEAAVIAPAIAVPIERRDLATLPEALGGDAGWLAALCRTPFDLDAGPLLRVGLLRLAPDRSRLVLVLHHLAADGWSAGIILQELASCYAAAREGRVAMLPPAVPIGAYNAWYATALATRGARVRRFWLETLADVPALALPTDALRPARRALEGARIRRELGAADLAALNAFCRAEGCTAFMVLLATWAALLARLSGQRRFALAVAGSGQAAMGVDRLVGQCAAMLPLPVDVAADEGFVALVGRLKADLMRLWDHQDLRPEDVAGDGLVLPPLRAAFNRDRDPGGWDFAGAEARMAPAPIGFIKYDLFLNVVETGGALLIDLDHDSALFGEATAAAWIDLYVALLRASLANPASRPHDFALPVAAVALPRSMAAPVLARIAAQAKAMPDRPALIRDGQVMTYAELRERLDRSVPVPVARRWIALFAKLDSDGVGQVVPARIAEHVDAWIDGAGLSPGMVLRLSDGALAAAGIDAWAAPLAAGATLVTGEDGPPADATLLLPVEAKRLPATTGRLLLIDDGTLLESALADLRQRLPETRIHVIRQPLGFPLSLGVAEAPAASPSAWRRLPPVEPSPALSADVRDAEGRPSLPGATGILHVMGESTGFPARCGASGGIALIGAAPDAAAVLLAHPAVMGLAVEDGARLRVAVGESGVGAGVLRRFLLRHLPATAMPAALAVTPDLADAAVWETGPAEAEPPTPEAAAIAALFARILRQDDAAPDDDFFDLGGDSLAAAQLVNGLRARFGVDLPQAVVFEAPTPALLAARLGATGTAVPIPRVSREGRLALSGAQRRLWFLDQLGRQGDAYVMGAALRIDGALDIAALHAALGDLVARHEALRTCFPLDGDQPVQAIRAPAGAAIDLPLIDATEASLPALLAETPRFDLATSPPLRAALYRLGADAHVLALHLHHIAGDGWSLAPLARDLSAAYAARRDGKPPSLPPLALHYADIAAWQDSRDLTVQEDFWRTELAGLPAAITLPHDLPRPRDGQARPAGRVPLHLDAALANRLRDLAHEERASLFMLLQAALATLLMRYGAGEDVPLGAPIANRAREEAEKLVGFFVNTLVLRCRLDGRPSFRRLVGRLRATDLAAFANQDLPFERVVEMLRPQRDDGETPLFQVLLMLGQEEAAALPLPGLRTRLSTLPPRAAKFDLAFALDEAATGGLDGTLEYDAGRFLPDTAARLARHFVALLASAAATPDVPVQRLRMLDAAERRALIAAAGPGKAACVTVTALLEEQAEATPEATAIVAADGSRLSYAGLHGAAERLARHLAARGIGPGDRVAIVCPRQPELLVAILGTLKAGAAYVPVDPAYPAERIALLLRDSAPAAVLAAGPVAETITHPALLRVDAASSAAEAAPRPATPDDAAYMIYTSGSTGSPKGVVLSHRAVASYLVWARDAFSTRQGNGAPINTSIGFDATVTSLFLPLISGTAIHLLPEADELEALAECLARERDFSLVKVTPAHLDVLRHLIPPEDLAGQARMLVIGGEALTAATIRAWRQHAPATRLINEYGPTEATVGCIVHEVGPATPDDGVIPIGRPTGNARIYLLDADLEPVPPGAVGEIFIGGAGVADGYFGRPDLTAHRFLPDPFVPPGKTSARMYRSGDRARLRADGVFLYLGRGDSQLKLRGHRIEPEEIEAALAGLPGIAQGAVALRRDSAGDMALSAWLVARPGVPAPTEATIRAALLLILPPAMVPSDFAWLPALPLSPNGKVDRARLAAMPLAAPAPAAPMPASAEEQALCEAFAEILDVPQVRPGDDFFALGGHSLLAARLANRLRARFGNALSLGDLFDAPTPAGLARLLAGHRAASATGPVLAPVADAADYPASANQRRLWILDRLDPGGASYNILGALALDGPVDEARLRDALAGLAARHESLRTAVVARDGAPRQQVMPSIAPPLTLLDLSTAADPMAEAQALMAREALAPIPLADAPLWRTWLLRLAAPGAEPRWLLLLKLHHAIADGWSLGVLLRDLAAMWNGTALPKLPVQARDFAAWQAACLDAPGGAEDRAWWAAHLRGAEGRLDLPLDRPRGRGTSGRGAQASRMLDAGTVATLNRLAAGAGTTLFPLQLALVAAVLHRMTGRDDIVLGTVVAGRDDALLHDQVAFFANTLALRITLRPEEAMAATIRRIGATVAEALRHAATPFEAIVEAAGAVREPGRTPLFDVLVAREPALAVPDFAGLRATAIMPPAVTRHFDLAFYFRDQADGIEIVAEYDSDLFDAWRIEAMCGHVAQLAAAAAEAPAAPLDALDMLAPAERQLLLHGLSGHATAYPRDASIVALFRDQARRRPDAVAVREAGGGSLTYAALDAASDRVAAHLGDARDELIGIAAAREPALIAGILGILKAGAAYVPVDPDYPAPRIAAMLDAAPIARVLTDEAGAARLPAGIRRIALADALRADGKAVPAPRQGSGSLAYVMFTSGSTGRPKAVAVPHRAVVRLVVGADYVTLGEDERLLLTGALSFDAATFEIWGMLLNGGTLVLAPMRALLDAPSMGRLLAEHAITTIWLTSSLFNHLVDSDAGIFAPLRQLLVGGERLSAPHVARVRAMFPALRLLNGYGPTENTTFSCVHPIDGVSADRDIPIGRPIANSRAWILGPGNHPSPIGVAGEICVGGDGLADGYYGQDELTRERFVPHPWIDGERIYRTGDFGCWLPDGSIAYLGRIDRQVKVRGVRIEMGEVEAALRDLPGVTRAAVIARARHGTTELLGYLVGPTQAEAERLRLALRDRLPPALVPANLIAVDALPIDPNGKLDHAALPQPEARQTPKAEGRAPANPLEAALCRLWAELLGRDSVDVEDGFFELGGHSLLATRMVDRIRDELGLAVELRDVFAAPTVAALAAQLLAAMLDARRPPRDVATIPALPPAEDHPASPTQRRLWFLHRLQGGGAAYNITGAWRLRGALDEAALRRAFDALAARHEALRTIFVERDGAPRQRILPALPPLGPAEVATESDIGAAIAREAAHVFDLARPLLRARLLHLAPDEAVLLINCHHMIADGWSMRVLAEELGALYAAARDGRAATLPPATAYKDAIAWRAPATEADRDWWRQALAAPPAPLDLPADLPRPARRDGRGAVLRRAMPDAVAAGLGRLAAAGNTTPFAAAVALVSALLHRLSGQSDLVIGTPVANRDAPALRGVVGFLADTLPLRLRIDAEAGFDALLAEAGNALAGALSHAAVPFDELVALAGGARDAARSPLFDVMVTLAEEAGGLALPGLHATALPCTEDAVQFDLTFRFLARPGGLDLDIAYATDLFTAARIEALAGWFTRLAEAATAAPATALARLPLLDAATREALARPIAAPPPSPSLVALFEAQVDRTPDRIAVSAEQVLSYAALDGLANALAATLAARGVRRGDRVGLALPASAGLVVGILGILKAGAAYVPVDPAHPEARLRGMLGDAGCRCVVGAAIGGLPDIALPVVPDERRPGLALAADDLAYVIFTSGSTGRPKGVMVEHGAVANLVRGLHAAIRATLPMDGPAGVAMLAAPVFDASVQQIFPALLSGDTLHPIPAALKQDPAALLRMLRERRIAIADGTPTLLDLLLAAGLDSASLPDLRHLVLGGEALRPDALRRLRANPAMAGLSVSNAYGPTECTVDATLFTLAPGDAVPDPVPIGRPLPHVEALVLDAGGEPVPDGIAGELWIAGAGLGRGYVGADAGGFAPHPLRAGERAYRTGDWAFRRADGQFVFLGRRDGQLKLRGHRIEAAEVEAAMLACIPGARQAAVTVQGEGAQAVLAGWVATDVALDAEAARQALEQVLPAWALPGRLAGLPALPLTPSGKVDRRALAEQPVATAPTLDDAPRDETEAAIIGIWAEILGREDIGRHRNFFALGGHSLGVLRVLALVEQRLGATVPVATFYGAPTVAELAQAILGAAPAKGTEAVPAAEDTFPLSPAQHRLWLIAELQPEATGYGMPAAFVLDGKLDTETLTGAITQVTARHEALRTAFTIIGGEPRQRVLPPTPPALVVEDVAGPEDAARIAAAEAARPFDLEAGPPLRWRLLRMAPQSHALLFNMHHIIGDGTSLAVIAADLGRAYDALVSGAANPLPPPRLQYRDAVRAMAERRRDDAAAEAWWRAQFAAPPPVLSLLADAPRTASATGPGANCPVPLPPALGAALRDYAARQETTPFAVALALVARLLHEASGDRDIVIGIPVSGRFHADFADQVGLYAETCPIRIAVAPDEPFTALQARVAQTLRGALSHDAFGFDRLVEVLDPPTEPGRSPFFDVMVTWQVAGTVPFRPAGLSVRPLPLPAPGAQFDLCFGFLDEDGGLALSILHRADLYRPARVAALGDGLVALATRLLEPDPDPGASLVPRLQRLWQEVLGRDAIGLDTPFVEAGGHSLKAARLVTRMHAEFGRTLRLREIFASPTIRAQAALLASAAPSAQAPTPAAATPPASVEAMAPASAAQRRLWALAQLAGDPAVYAIGSVLHLDGALDVPALERALGGLVARHEALRTVFSQTPDGLHQRILPVETFHLPVLAPAEADAQHLSFDLAHGPLFQARLVRLDAGRHRLDIVLHHAIADGASMAVLARDLGTLYAAARRGDHALLPPPSMPYREAVARQLAWLAGPEGAAAGAYWRDALGSDLPVLELPTDRPRPALQGFRGALREAMLPPAALDRLRGLAAAQGASLFAVLVAAFYAVLHRHGGQEDIILGTPVAGRVDPALEDAVGLHANAVALRLRCAGDAPFADLLAQTRDIVAGALDHQLYPFDVLVEQLGVPRDPSRSPVFDAFVAMQDEAPAAPAMDGLAVRIGGEDGGIAKFDLSLHLRPSTGGLGLWLEYNTDLFDAARIDRMAGHLVTLLHALPEETGCAVGRLPILTPEDVASQQRWTAAAPLPAHPDTLLHAFARQVTAAPGRIAMRDRHAAHDYGALDAWSNGIAAALMAQGLERGDRVAVAMPRGATLPAAIIGIWKAGLVYVPIDHAQPQARRDLLLADAGCRAVIGTAMAGLPAIDPHAVTPRAEPPAVAAPAGDDPAYILYTSGSSGTPKGVAIAHRNLAAFAAAMPAPLGLRRDDIILALTTISFDISLLELACPLAHGMTIAVADDAACADPAATLDWLRDSGATVLQVTPSRLALLLGLGGSLGAVRHILVGGERLPPALAATLHGLSDITAINVYGPTETTIWSTAEPISDAPPGIGWPLPGEAALILSPLGEEQPIGVPGEIVIAGAGVGLGYLGRPALTADRFVTGDDGAARYRTGDRGARRADGGIDYLGRIDDQVKLHGFRIEPGEVEAALRSHAAVREAAVVVRDLRGQPELVGYAVAPTIGQDALRRHLLGLLPRHMVPAVLVLLDEMPLLPSGKIDRKALPAPAEDATPEAPALPADATEEAVLRHWRRVLLRPQATPTDEFFESGGHSLRAAELAGLVQAELGVPVGLRDLFLFTTPRRLAAELGQRRAAAVPGLVATAGAADYPLSRAQRRLFALDRMHPGATAYLIAGAFRLDGTLDAKALSRALDATIARHEALRTAFRMIDGAPRQIVLPPVAGALRLRDVADDAAVAGACATVAETPFDLAEAPLLRAELLRLAPDRHVLAFAVHHIVADGVSLGLILDDLEAAYRAALDGASVLLPPAAFQYRDHAAREAALEGTPRWQASREWWHRHLAGPLPVLDLPASNPRPARRSGRGGHVPFAIDAVLAGRLDELARARGATTFMLLLAAKAALYHRLTGATDMVLGSVSGNRDVAELAQVVGCFVNPLPLRLAIAPQASVAALLDQVRDVVLQALDHADYPFDALVRDLRAGADPTRTPIFDVGLSWNALPHMARHDFAGCAMVPLDAGDTSAKYDLLLIAAPTADGGVEGVIEYATDLFEAVAVEAMARRLRIILEQAAAAPDIALDLLDLGLATAAPSLPAPLIELQF